MNGIEKITGRIEADAQEQAKTIAAEAEAKCAEIRADYDKQAQDQYWARVRDGVKACEDRVQRMGRLAEMEARKSVLALKQEMVDAAFAAALERICTMPQADYVAYLAKLAAQAVTPLAAFILSISSSNRLLDTPMTTSANICTKRR